MTTFEPSQQNDLLPMELPESMSSPEVFHAKTLALRVVGLASARELGVDFTQKSFDLLATFDPVSSSWRTSQLCLVAQASGQAGGLAEFSETWPPSGMMRNGKIYRRQPWALPIAESASGLWPTPVKQMSQRKTVNGKNMSLTTGQTFGLSLAQAVKMWPTPTACMGKGSSLASLTRKDGKSRINDQLDHAVMAADGGALNPTWVEALMGFPHSWTDMSAED